MTYFTTFGPVVLFAALLYWFTTIIQAARLSLTPDQLMEVEKLNRVSAVSMIVPLIPLFAASIATEKFPEYRMLPFAIGVVLTVLVLLAVNSRLEKRVQAAGLPASYVAAVKKGNLVLLLMFASIVAFLFFTKILRHVGS